MGAWRAPQKSWSPRPQETPKGRYTVFGGALHASIFLSGGRLTGQSTPVAFHDTLLGKILGGHADANIAFDDLRTLLRFLGFRESIRGSHHVFRPPGVRQVLTDFGLGRGDRR